MPTGPCFNLTLQVEVQISFGTSLAFKFFRFPATQIRMLILIKSWTSLHFKSIRKSLAPGPPFKLKENDISRNLQEFLTEFLKGRKRKVVLNGKNSSWLSIEVGVSQGLF